MRIRGRRALSPRARARLATTIDSMLRETSVRRGPMRGLQPLVRSDVALAVEHDLRRIAAALLDANVTIRCASAARLESFLLDGATSPLYATDEVEAAATARELEELIVPPKKQAASRPLAA